MPSETLEAFDTQLASILNEIDQLLEARYGQQFRLRPTRPASGSAANPQYDGLFSVIANFSAGIGSQYGAGYTLDLRATTSDPIPQELQLQWENLMVETLRKRLPEVFPHRVLHVAKDFFGWKVYGDLSL
ncbi:MAG: hypothetical protein RSD41_04370 [Kiritimatiellia bacterium]